MFKAKAYKYTLDFKKPSGTSRGVLKQKESWFIKTWFEDEPEIFGIGECGLLKGLSYDDVPNYEQKVNEVCENINNYSNNFHTSLKNFPSIRFGLEMALMDSRSLGKRMFYQSDFTAQKAGIPINGLVWMGTEEFMKEQIEDKLKNGFDCIKMKIGAIDFDTEYELLKTLRKRFSKETIEIRVDANGAFSIDEVDQRLELLAKLDIHSIEQPIKQGQIDEMAKLCARTPLAIALDEELIGVNDIQEKQALLKAIQPQFIILKPSLVGGFQASEEWLIIAKQLGIDWWATSALESNIGLNAIAQWTAFQDTNMYQGLGTGGLYTNNIEAPLEIKKGKLWINNEVFELGEFE
ncbi:MAG: O-succinylbenzoate synthase [Planctomycetota bacterium]|jgi:O-succinylbenzoate synthase